MNSNTFSLPPNSAKLKVIGAIPTVAEVNEDLTRMGLSASDLKPIDWRKLVKLLPPMNQKSCGDCWAMSSTAALCDRFRIQKTAKDVILQPTMTAQCVKIEAVQNVGCNGGYPISAGQFFETNGLPEATGDCVNWPGLCQSSDCSSLPTCNSIKNKCLSSNPIIYKALRNSTKNLSTDDKNMTIVNIKKALMRGPVVAAFNVLKEFMVSGIPGGNKDLKWGKTGGIYISGEYDDVFDSYLNSNNKGGNSANIKAYLQNLKGSGKWTDVDGGHAVEVVGWDKGDAGKYKNIEYWIVKNSWGTDYMDGGYFKIAISNQPDGRKFNTNIGFDCPIILDGELFGGCVTFDPDLNTGRGEPIANFMNPQEEYTQNKTAFYIGLAVLIAILVAVIYHLYKKYHKPKANFGFYRNYFY